MYNEFIKFKIPVLMSPPLETEYEVDKPCKNLQFFENKGCSITYQRNSR